MFKLKIIIINAQHNSGPVMVMRKNAVLQGIFLGADSHLHAKGMYSLAARPPTASSSPFWSQSVVADFLPARSDTG
jgi:hypothetical protein